MNKNIKRMIELVDRSNNYVEFESKVMKFLNWYVGHEFRMWTKTDLNHFYYRNGGK